MRARELGVTLPDATLQVRALDTVMSRLLKADPQATFRVQSFRLREEVDIKPDQATVDKLFEMLQAECDQMLHNRASAIEVFDDKPTVKAFSTSTRPGDNATPCRWWGTDNGCKAGKACSFAHAALEDKIGRCWVCSSKHHMKSECPTRIIHGEQVQTAPGGSDGDAKGKGKLQSQGQKGKQKGKGGKKGDKGRIEENAGKSTAATPTTTTQEDKTQVSKPHINKVESAGEGASSTEAASASLMTEVTSLLRSLRVGEAEPSVQLRACHLMKFEVEGCEMILIDGGATHCLRAARTPEEWGRAEKVKVMVASGEVELRRGDQHHPRRACGTRNCAGGSTGGRGLQHPVGPKCLQVGASGAGQSGHHHVPRVPDGDEGGGRAPDGRD